jgi:hypothetical protein
MVMIAATGLCSRYLPPGLSAMWRVHDVGLTVGSYGLPGSSLHDRDKFVFRGEFAAMEI